MSAEKDILDYWLNRNGYFTINNLKTKNKDIGILAIRFDKKKPSFFHFVITLSVRSTFLDSGNVEKNVNDFVNHQIELTYKKIDKALCN